MPSSASGGADGSGRYVLDRERDGPRHGVVHRLVRPPWLASLVLALLALEAVGSAADDAVAVIAVTVVLSVLAHGVSAAPLAARYGKAASARGPEPGGAVRDMPVHGLPRARDAGRDRPTALGDGSPGRG
jgi:hypothetical protein